MPRFLQLRRIPVPILLLWVAFFCIPSGVIAAEPEMPTLRVAVNGAPPYRIVLRESNTTLFSGLYVEIIREAATRARLALLFMEAPYVRALDMMKNGKVDLMLGPNRVPERERYMEYLRVPLPREAKVFYLRPGLADIDSYDSLAGHGIGVLRGAVYFPDFDADDTLKKIPVPSYTSALRLVAQGRLDAAIMPELLGDFLTKSSGITLKKGSYRVSGQPSYIVMSKKSPVLQVKERLELALEGMTADGTIDRIVAEYR